MSGHNYRRCLAQQKYYTLELDGLLIHNQTNNLYIPDNNDIKQEILKITELNNL
jgi:hypothetical protein